jgi:hypothetical protein
VPAGVRARTTTRRSSRTAAARATVTAVRRDVPQTNGRRLHRPRRGARVHTLRWAPSSLDLCSQTRLFVVRFSTGQRR